MNGKVEDAREHIESASLTRPATGKECDVHAHSPPWGLPPPLRLLPNTVPAMHAPPWKRPEWTRALKAGSSEEHPQERAAFQPGPPQAFIPQVLNPGDSQTTTERRAFSSIEWLEKNSSHLPGLPASSHASARDLEKASLPQQHPHSSHSDLSNAYGPDTIYTDCDDIPEGEKSREHALWILVLIISSPEPLSFRV